MISSPQFIYSYTLFLEYATNIALYDLWNRLFIPDDQVLRVREKREPKLLHNNICFFRIPVSTTEMNEDQGFWNTELLY